MGLFHCDINELTRLRSENPSKKCTVLRLKTTGTALLIKEGASGFEGEFMKLQFILGMFATLLSVSAFAESAEYFEGELHCFGTVIQHSDKAILIQQKIRTGEQAQRNACNMKLKMMLSEGAKVQGPCTPRTDLNTLISSIRQDAQSGNYFVQVSACFVDRFSSADSINN